MDRKQEEKNSVMLFLMIMVFFTVVCFSALFGTVGFGSLYGPVTPATASVTTQTAAIPSLVNVNEADVNELARLPGIGETLAGRIVTYREQHGSFTSTEQLKLVEGIGEKKWEAISPYVTV